jgi:hypothetical protein
MHGKGDFSISTFALIDRPLPDAIRQLIVMASAGRSMRRFIP